MRVALLILLAGVAAQAQTPSVKPYLRIETGAHVARVGRIDVDAAQRFLASASNDKTARIWDLHTGKLLKIFRPPIGDGDQGKLYALAFSPDGTTLAVGGFTGVDGSSNFPIYIFDRESGAIRKTITGLPDVTDHLAFSRDGRYLAAGLGAPGNGLRIYETAGYSEVARDLGYGETCNWLEFEPSGNLITASYDGFIREYSSDFHLLRQALVPTGKRVASAHLSPDGKLIVVGFDDTATVDVLSAEDLTVQYKVEPPSDGMNLLSTLWSEDGTTLCAAGRYAPKGDLYPVLCWGDQGKGKVSTYTISGDTIMDILPLHGGAMAFCDGTGAVGVLAADGTPQWRAAPDLLDYGGGPSFPKLSADGSRVEVASYYLYGTQWTHHQVTFSVPDQTLQIDTESNPALLSPVNTGLAVAQWKNEEHPTLNGRALSISTYEISRSLAISPDKNSFVLGTDWNLRKFDLQGNLLWRIPVPGVAWGVNISTDGRFVVAALFDGTVRWYAFDTGKEVLALFVDRDLNRWVEWNPDGFFTFQRGGDSLIGYQVDRTPGHEGEFVKVDQLREVFYQSDLLAQILKPSGAGAVLAARHHLGDISGVLSAGLPPEIELVSASQQTVADQYLLQFRIKDMGGGRGRIVYRIDGVEIEGRAVDIAGTGGDVINRYIPVASGVHTLTVTAYGANNKIEGQPKTVQITRSLPSPGTDLYVVAAGISHYSDHSLWEGVKFASADADQVAASFRAQEGKGLFRKVSAVSLPDGQATVKGIGSAVALAAKKVQPGDTFVLYLAGHGEAVEGEYYFIPWEAEYTNQDELLKESLNREAIQALLKQIPTNKSVLILDTCGAGAFLEGRATTGEKAAQEKIALMSGRAVLAASNSQEMAMDGYQNHGVFTYALLQGLQQADSDAQGEILISRLAEFVQSHVPAITEERWHYRQLPLSKMEGEPFPIAHKLAP